MIIQVSTATPHQLNFLVALIEAYDVAPFAPGQKVLVRSYDHEPYVPFSPSTDPRDGSPLLEVNKINTRYEGGDNKHRHWHACTCFMSLANTAYGETHLLAGIRCLVVKHFGATAEIPDDL